MHLFSYHYPGWLLCVPWVVAFIGKWSNFYEKGATMMWCSAFLCCLIQWAPWSPLACLIFATLAMVDLFYNWNFDKLIYDCWNLMVHADKLHWSQQLLFDKKTQWVFVMVLLQFISHEPVLMTPVIWMSRITMIPSHIIFVITTSLPSFFLESLTETSFEHIFIGVALISIYSSTCISFLCRYPGWLHCVYDSFYTSFFSGHCSIYG